MKAKVAIAVIAAVAVIGGIFVVSSFMRGEIPAGKVGVVYSLNGGVQEEILHQGMNFVSPFEEVREFTVGNEQMVLSKDKREGSPEDDSFTVATSDDANISVSFQMSYRFVEEDIVDTYKKFKGMDGEDIVEKRVKTVLKSKISEVTTNYSMMDIYSGNRSKINQELTEYLNKELRSEYGIEVMNASIIDVHPDAKLKEAIDNRVTALQEKQQAEAEQEKIKVQKATEQLQAEADAKIAITKAEAQAEKTRIEAQAEADANKMKSESLTPELIQMKEAEARLKHGWVEVQTGSSDVIIDGK